MKLAYSKYQSGFTLLEMVIVMILISIMSVGIASMVVFGTQIYKNVSDRDELIANARFVVERLNREVRNAVPNSVRETSDANSQCLEFIPIIASTTYTTIPIAPITSQTAQVIPTENNFCTTLSGICLETAIVYPIESADVYGPITNPGSRFQLKSVDDSATDRWEVTFNYPGNAPVAFDQGSPTRRMYIVDSPVSYCMRDNSIFRYEDYGISNTQLLEPPAARSLMAEHLADFDPSDLPFKVTDGRLQVNSLVESNLHFRRNGESFYFHHQIHVTNIP